MGCNENQKFFQSVLVFFSFKEVADNRDVFEPWYTGIDLYGIFLAQAGNDGGLPIV